MMEKLNNSLQQRDEIERWQKISMGFNNDYIFVLDHERDKVLEALRKTEDYLAESLGRHEDKVDKGVDRSVLEVPMGKIRSLRGGPILIATNQVVEYNDFRIGRFSLEKLLSRISPATQIPRLIQ